MDLPLASMEALLVLTFIPCSLAWASVRPTEAISGLV